MDNLDKLLEQLRGAIRDSDINAVADVVRSALHEQPLAPEFGSSRLLHSEPGLTVLHAVVNPGFASPPHDHRTWAVIGVYEGQEDNTFYRLAGSSRRIEQTGKRNLKEGEVLMLEADAIHQIANPLSRKLIALHIYGKNIFEIERSAWDTSTGNERPFKLALDARGQVRP